MNLLGSTDVSPGSLSGPKLTLSVGVYMRKGTWSGESSVGRGWGSWWSWASLLHACIKIWDLEPEGCLDAV